MKRAYPVTFFLIFVNVAVFVLDDLQKGNLTQLGALYGPPVAAGQWYRLFTYAFLHGGIAHLFVNMLSLYFMGTFVESVMGSFRTILLYVISLVGSALAIYYFNFNAATVGASGAIFGLFGALFAVGIRSGKAGRQLLQQAVPILILNLVFTFSVPGISIAGHLGGLAIGFLCGLVLYHPPRPVYAQVVDANTGETLESHVETP